MQQEERMGSLPARPWSPLGSGWRLMTADGFVLDVQRSGTRRRCWWWCIRRIGESDPMFRGDWSPDLHVARQRAELALYEARRGGPR